MSSPQPPTAGRTYRERLSVPPGWWLLLGFLALTMVVAVWAILDTRWALGTLAVLAVLVVGLLLGYGGVRVRVDQSGLRAGGAHLQWPWLAGATPLDQRESEQALVAAADGSTWLLVRSYTKGAVLVDLDDPADPHRQWLVSSRHPEELAAAITSWLPPEPSSAGHRQGSSTNPETPSPRSNHD